MAGCCVCVGRKSGEMTPLRRINDLQYIDGKVLCRFSLLLLPCCTGVRLISVALLHASAARHVATCLPAGSDTSFTDGYPTRSTPISGKRIGWR